VSDKSDAIAALEAARRETLVNGEQGHAADIRSWRQKEGV